MCVLMAKLDGPCWLGTPWAVSASHLVLMFYCSPAFYWEVLPVPASSPGCRAVCHCCQSVANEWLEFAQSASDSTGNGPLTFPALDTVVSQKQSEQRQIAILFQALCEHWDAVETVECLWTRTASVEKEERTSWAEWEYPKSMNSFSSWWMQLPKSFLHLYSSPYLAECSSLHGGLPNALKVVTSLASFRNK